MMKRQKRKEKRHNDNRREDMKLIKRLLLHLEFAAKLICVPFLNAYEKANATWVYRRITFKQVYDGHYGKP